MSDSKVPVSPIPYVQEMTREPSVRFFLEDHRGGTHRRSFDWSTFKGWRYQYEGGGEIAFVGISFGESFVCLYGSNLHTVLDAMCHLGCQEIRVGRQQYGPGKVRYNFEITRIEIVANKSLRIEESGKIPERDSRRASAA